MHPETIAVHSGRPAGNGGPLVPPIAIANAYGFDDISSYDDVESGRSAGYTYSRDGSPTSEALERAVAELEGGSAAAALSAGVAAISMTLLALLPRRGTVVASPEIFGGTNTMLREVLQPLGFDVRWVDFGQLARVEAELGSCPPGQTVVICESISNPHLRVPDLAGLASIAHAAGAVLVVDNTLATPLFCRPLAHGADVVVHSASKYLGGHADLVGGLAVGSPALVEAIRLLAIRLGARLDPFAAWLALRGLRTLPLRMREAARNAQVVAETLARHPLVETVLYPGLSAEPVVGQILPGGHGAMVSFVLRDGADAARTFVDSLQMIRFVGSLGDVATSVSHPATTSHRRLTPAQRNDLGITEGFLRLSIGIEASEDIIADIERALGAVAAR
jgi:cystathionine beta-lyase/cystathionine gamma-synthase